MYTRHEGCYNNLPCQVAGLIQGGTDGAKFSITSHFSKSELRAMTPSTAYSIIAAQEALEDAKGTEADDWE
jgi:3-oxoacyl-(acyl-carrier-protein) synthase